MKYRTKLYIQSFLIFLLGLYVGLSVKYILESLGYGLTGFLLGLLISNSVAIYAGLYPMIKTHK